MIYYKTSTYLTDYGKLSGEIHQLLAAVSSVSGATNWTEPQILADLKRAEVTYYLAYDDQQLVAFLASQTVADETEITNLAVLPDYQKQGLATHFLKHLKGRTIFLEVRSSNLNAQALYEKMGFKPYNRRKNYYQNPLEDAVLMKKDD